MLGAFFGFQPWRDRYSDMAKRLHELTVLEMLHSQAEFSPGASLTAVTREPPAALLG